MKILERGVTGLSLAGVLVLLLGPGCGREATEPPAVAPTQTADVPLPEWAPESPSEEFLRAARVLKPMPSDMPTAPDVPEEVLRAIMALKERMDLPCWELFGTLSDEQMDRFLATERVELRVPDLTDRQRAALEAVFDACEGFELEGAELDFGVILYKGGALEDLSNVDVGFKVVEGQVVGFFATLRGEEGEATYGGFAHI
jgi:hypothetical protein